MDRVMGSIPTVGAFFRSLPKTPRGLEKNATSRVFAMETCPVPGGHIEQTVTSRESTRKLHRLMWAIFKLEQDIIGIYVLTKFYYWTRNVKIDDALRTSNDGLKKIPKSLEAKNGHA
ncbi:hypothetical protein DPMN_105296 [Dreissena polymorpha]|uniref:Uncharacterized protein n=1 Tax=Dreissena polymorpha TaxID=45954 RepID=A0A9D4HGM0_DREPO|nr:hypothetical protein DPMN_105296 [Dreissena polymorpha]